MKKNLMNYLIPSIIVSILGGIYVIIDGIFIGKYIGDDGLTAINIAWPITALIQTVGLAIGTSAGVVMSIYEGKKEEQKKNDTEIIAICLLIISTIIMATILIFINRPLLKLLGASSDVLLDYGEEYLRIIIIGSIFQVFGMGLAPILRNKGKVKTVMIAMISGSVGNFIGDYILMAIFKMGLSGAAIASVFGQTITGVICLLALLINKKWNFNIKSVKNIDLIKGIFKIFPSPFVLSYSASFLLIITNLTCMKYGGSKCIATYTIYSYIIYIIQACGAGCSDGAQPLLSYYYGANDKKKLEEIRNNLYLFTAVFIALIAIILIIFKSRIIELFEVSNEVNQLYYDGYIYFIVGLLFIGIVKISSGYLYAIENVKKSNIMVLLDPLVINPILLFTLPILLGINGIWLSYSISQIILTILGIFLVFGLKSAKNQSKTVKIS